MRFAIGTMGLRKLGEIRVEKLKNSMVNVRSAMMKMMLIRAMTTVLLWICLVQLTTLGGSLGPRVLKGWPSCFTQDSHSAAALDVKLLPVHARVLPHKTGTLLALMMFSVYILGAICLQGY
ncbi:hypothetical protein Hanom_Chr00s120569g01811421 [Helianthus anomalus]